MLRCAQFITCLLHSIGPVTKALEGCRLEGLEMDQIANLLSSLDCAGPASEDSVSEAEARLGLLFPPSYRQFLLSYGAALGEGIEVFGLDMRLESGEMPQWSDVVEATLSLRPDCLPGDSIQISHDGMDNGFFLHCSKSDADYEGPVIAWGPDHDAGVRVAKSFHEWLLASSKAKQSGTR